ncbi:permease [Paenibacillus senegalensis]|uniref:permease n=1 Tax=Paenibacillus senegalensis TaxID=1465766 RepID=UPI000474B2A9
MQSAVSRWGVSLLLITFLSFMLVLVINKDAFAYLFDELPAVQSFKTMFISIILEALPFVLLGVLLSSLLHVFVSERLISRLIPRNPFIGVLTASSLGLLIPVCECGMIPVVRRLMRKGMPLYMAVVFILTGPIINPVVFWATFEAFRSRPEMAYSRIGLAFAAAAAIGLLIYYFVSRSPLRPDKHYAGGHQTNNNHGHHANHNHHQHAYHNHRHHANHSHDHHAHDHGPSSPNKLLSALNHAADEFFEMGKYLIFGSILAAFIQTFMARESLVAIGQGEWSSHMFMMAFAFIVSLCSTSDAFVAASFGHTFTAGSLLTFLVFGPMIDMKGTLMLLSIFKMKFVILLIVLVAGFVMFGSMIWEQVFL